jgi:hypothetical protein
MSTKPLIYKAGTFVRNYIRASPSKITLTKAHCPSSKMIPVGMRKQALRAPPTFQVMAAQRIAVLDAAIAAIDLREDANSKKLKKRAQHLAEKADLERQLGQPDQAQLGGSSSAAMYVTFRPANIYLFLPLEAFYLSQHINLELVTDAMKLR